MTPEPAPLAVGLIGLPDLAGPLRRAGFRVVTGDGFLGAAGAVKRAIDAGAALPVLIRETTTSGMGAYVTALAGRGVTTVLLRSGRQVIDADPPVAVVALPAAVDQVLAAGGLGPVGGTTGTATLGRDGTVQQGEQPPPPTSDATDPWADDDAWLERPEKAPPDVWIDRSGFGPATTRPAEVDDDREIPGSVAVDPWAVFDAAPDPRPAPRPGHRVNDRRADVLFVFSGKGGVGKTSVALGLAERAARHLRVVLVDANRGQGDIRTYLRLGSSNLPTIWAAAATGDPARAIVPPDALTAARHQRLQELHFALVMAPHGDQVDPAAVTPQAYRAVLAAARDRADLVVVDTQIVEDGLDTTGLIDELMVPALRAGGWGLAVADTSAAGLTNTLDRVRAVHRTGVPPDRLMAALSRVPADFTPAQITAVAELFGRHTTFLGHVPATAALQNTINLGRIEHRDPALAPVLDRALLRVTGDPVFQPADNGARAPRRWLLRIGGRK